MKKPHLLFYWERFVNQREWKNSVLLCETFGKEIYLNFRKAKNSFGLETRPSANNSGRRSFATSSQLTNSHQYNKTSNETSLPRRSNAKVFYGS